MHELELFAAAVVNAHIEQLFLDWGYQRELDTVPAELGGGTMEILTRLIPIPG